MTLSETTQPPENNFRVLELQSELSRLSKLAEETQKVEEVLGLDKNSRARDRALPFHTESLISYSYDDSLSLDGFWPPPLNAYAESKHLHSLLQQEVSLTMSMVYYPHFAQHAWSDLFQELTNPQVSLIRDVLLLVNGKVSLHGFKCNPRVTSSQLPDTVLGGAFTLKDLDECGSTLENRVVFISVVVSTMQQLYPNVDILERIPVTSVIGDPIFSNRLIRMLVLSFPCSNCEAMNIQLAALSAKQQILQQMLQEVLINNSDQICSVATNDKDLGEEQVTRLAVGGFEGDRRAANGVYELSPPHFGLPLFQHVKRDIFVYRLGKWWFISVCVHGVGEDILAFFVADGNAPCSSTLTNPPTGSWQLCGQNAGIPYVETGANAGLDQQGIALVQALEDAALQGLVGAAQALVPFADGKVGDKIQTITTCGSLPTATEYAKEILENEVLPDSEKEKIEKHVTFANIVICLDPLDSAGIEEAAKTNPNLSQEVMDEVTAHAMCSEVEEKGGTTLAGLHICLQWENSVEQTDLDMHMTCPVCNTHVCYQQKTCSCFAPEESKVMKKEEHLITFRNLHRLPIGMEVETADDQSLVIRSIEEGQLIYMWNQGDIDILQPEEVQPNHSEQPEEVQRVVAVADFYFAIEEGDYVVEVNGIRNNQEDMRAHLQEQSTELTLKLERRRTDIVKEPLPTCLTLDIDDMGKPEGVTSTENMYIDQTVDSQYQFSVVLYSGPPVEYIVAVRSVGTVLKLFRMQPHEARTQNLCQVMLNSAGALECFDAEEKPFDWRDE